MQEEWWEDPLCWICDYWWLLLAGFALILGLWFARGIWIPLVVDPEPTPTVQPTATQLPPTVTPEPELGTGDLQITLRWNSLNDLDLFVTDPSGKTIFYDQRSVPSGGMLDVDSNRNCKTGVSSRPVENIYWPRNAAPRGKYRVEVFYFQKCAGAPLTEAFTVRMLVDGNATEIAGVTGAVQVKQKISDFSR